MPEEAGQEGQKRLGRGQNRPGRGQKRPRRGQEEAGRGQEEARKRPEAVRQRPEEARKRPAPGGGGPEDVPAKTLGGFYLYTTPWEVPEGPACMVPVA